MADSSHGRLYTWGRSSHCQLGHGTHVSQGEPRYLEAFRKMDVVQVACGDKHVLARTSDDSVFSWGFGGYGRLGHGNTVDVPLPRSIDMFIGKSIVHVACGDDHSAALTKDGSVYTWGYGYDGQLGQNSTKNIASPKEILELSEEGIVQVVCGTAHTIARTVSGTLWAWGNNNYGRLGLGIIDGGPVLLPKVVKDLQGIKIVKVACGDTHTMALDTNGVLYSWGEGKYGQLGHGDNRNLPVPKVVEALAGIRVKQVESCSLHSVALSDKGVLYTWGCGFFGQLGHGDTQNKSIPLAVPMFEGKVVVSVASRKCHSLALTQCGTMYAWGSGKHGKLGCGSEATLTVPTPVTFFEHKSVVQLACGGDFSIALVSGPLSDDEERVRIGYLSCVQKFWNNKILTEDDTIVDGFYDVGTLRSLPSFRALQHYPVLEGAEVLYVDRSTDERLHDLCERSISLVQDKTNLVDNVKQIAGLVSSWFGGAQQTTAHEDVQRMVKELQHARGSSVIPIGELKAGTCRHRAILFKYMCDLVDVPSRLVATTGTSLNELTATPGQPISRELVKEGDQMHLWNVIVVDHCEYVVDLLHYVGNLYDVGSEQANLYHTCEQVPRGTMGLNSNNSGQFQMLMPAPPPQPTSGSSFTLQSPSSIGPLSAASMRRETLCGLDAETTKTSESSNYNSRDISEFQTHVSGGGEEHVSGHVLHLNARLKAAEEARELEVEGLRSQLRDLKARLRVAEVNNSQSSDWEISFEDIEIGRRIGKGGFGKVYKGRWRGTDVAVKKLFFQNADENTLKEFRSEVAMMSKLRHPNCVLFMGAVTRPPNLSIVTEYLSRGSLWDVLHNKQVPLDWKTRLKIALDSARGMIYLHKSNPVIIHRDLKSLNILVDGNWNAKIGDFGLSRMKIHPTSNSTHSVGTPQWMAPEILSNQPYNESADVYSFGIILWEILTRQLPFKDMHPMQVGMAVITHGMRPEIPSSCPPKYAGLMTSCWQKDPAARPSFEQIFSTLEQVAYG